MTRTETLQSFKPFRTSRCDLYNRIIHDIFLDLNGPRNERGSSPTDIEEREARDGEGTVISKHTTISILHSDVDDENDNESEKVSLGNNVGYENETSIMADLYIVMDSVKHSIEADRNSVGFVFLSAEKRP